MVVSLAVETAVRRVVLTAELMVETTDKL
jgi:hypothetical protein